MGIIIFVVVGEPILDDIMTRKLNEDSVEVKLFPYFFNGPVYSTVIFFINKYKRELLASGHTDII